MIGALGLLALGYGVYARARLGHRYGAALALLGVMLVGLEVYAQLYPAAAPATELEPIEVEPAAIRVQVAQTQLRAAGLALPRTGDAGQGIVAVDGDFSARIIPVGDKFRVERTGYPPLEGVTLPDAVAKVLEAHPHGR